MQSWDLGPDNLARLQNEKSTDLRSRTSFFGEVFLMFKTRPQKITACGS